MCGVAGFWGRSHAEAVIAEQMALQIEARGPDSSGLWSDSEVGIAMAHRRLSILDLSPAGAQPMRSSCGKYTLAYNGEIYNHEDLRKELKAEKAPFVWRGHSDTETLLAALVHWGVQGALERLNGMFAFAFWDSVERTLILARDRMGEKPLYYGHSGGVFLFGSELKALAAHPHWQGNVNRDALALFMRHSYIPAPHSIYQGIFKLLPAHYLVIREAGSVLDQPQCYWNLAGVAESGSHNAFDGDSKTLGDELELLLGDAVKRRMAADVPLGAFLSGGYDSTIVAALMQSQSDLPIQTFTIGFSEEGYNEAVHAKAVAKHLGTNHTELYVTPEQAMGVIPKLPRMYDEPFADSSQIPTYLVSQLARKDVTVSLSGDGGDELFYGYDRYFRVERMWRIMSQVPMPFRKVLREIVVRAPGNAIEFLMMMLPKKFQVAHLADRLLKLAAILDYPTGEAFYREFVSHTRQPEKLVLGAQEPATILGCADQLPTLSNLRERMMYMDSMTYLPDDILTKVDRATMAVSLEARVPMLDHRLVEFSWRLPHEYKSRNGRGKWLLREVTHRHVPKALMERPKMGFGVPIDQWLRGPLREWAEALLSESRLKQDGFFDTRAVRKMWEEHISGKRRWHYHLWDVLMFQAWLEEWH